MYDMYPWNEPDSGANHDQDQTAAAWLPAPRNGSRHANGARRINGDDVPADFAKAVQFALDRRDNGGDAVVPPAPQPVTPPAVSLTRQ